MQDLEFKLKKSMYQVKDSRTPGNSLPTHDEGTIAHWKKDISITVSPEDWSYVVEVVHGSWVSNKVVKARIPVLKYQFWMSNHQTSHCQIDLHVNAG